MRAYSLPCLGALGRARPGRVNEDGWAVRPAAKTEPDAKSPMANNEDTLIREVEEELRRERMQELWNRYGTYFLIAAIALVAAVWGVRFYNDRKAAAAAAAGASFNEALQLAEKSKAEEARAAFEKIASGGPAGYAALARLQLAAAAAKAGDRAKAATEYAALADDKGADATLRSLAALNLAMLKVGDGAFTEVENRLNDLAADTSPWRSNAREMIAVGALKAGQTEKARSALERILADAEAPPSVRERSQILLGGIVAADLASVAKPAATAPAATPPAAAPQAPAAATPTPAAPAQPAPQGQK